MSDCLFCRIAKGEITTEKVFENDSVLAFKDLRPQAKLHYLFIHKDHSQNLNEMMKLDPEQAKDIFLAIKDFTESEKLTSEGYRVVNNIGRHAGQTVFHTHFHVLGGEPLGHFGS